MPSERKIRAVSPRGSNRAMLEASLAEAAGGSTWIVNRSSWVSTAASADGSTERKRAVMASS